MSRTWSSTSWTERVAVRAVPLELLQRALLADPLDHQADRAGLGALRRVRDVAAAAATSRPRGCRSAAGPSVGHDVDVHVALDLVEPLLVRVDVEVGALVRAADDHAR